MRAIEPTTRREAGLRRLFLLQLLLVTGATLLLVAGLALERARGGQQTIGVFWFAFLSGCLGSSIAILRRTRVQPRLAVELGRSWIALLVPHLYGGLMAGVAYLLFMSRILSATGSGGLLTSNLFPDFSGGEAGTLPTISAYFAMRPATLPDVGRLLVWCFLAGYSERFVTRVLDQLGASLEREAPAGNDGADASSASAPRARNPERE